MTASLYRRFTRSDDSMVRLSMPRTAEREVPNVVSLSEYAERRRRTIRPERIVSRLTATIEERMAS